MADSDLGTRVHSQVDGTNGRVQVKSVGADDATLGAAAAYQQRVDSDGNAHVEVHGEKPGAAGDVKLLLSELGAPNSDGLYHGTANTDPASTGLVGLVRNIAPADSQQTLRLTAKANGDGSVRSLDIALHDENGEPYSRTNPVPVSIEESEGTEVQNYKGGADIASLGTDNHDYVVVSGTTFYLNRVLCDASGDARYELQIGDGAGPEVFTTVAVKFSSNSKGGDIELGKGVAIVAGGSNRTVRVVRKNLDNKLQQVSTTIIGVI